MEHRDREEITKAIVHCSDTSDSDEYTSNDIRRWHLDRGFSDIGYHIVIRRCGIIEWGRSEQWLGAHCKGYNRESIGICLVGRKNFTKEQAVSLMKVYRYLNIKYDLTVLDWYTHNALTDKKTCPNFSRPQLIEFLENWLEYFERLNAYDNYEAESEYDIDPTCLYQVDWLHY